MSTAYNRWTQFESFPRFTEGVERIDQVTETRTHRVTKIAGVEREFDAEITEQHPDERIAWKTENGTHQTGVVTFHRLDDSTSRVMLQLDRPREVQLVHRVPWARGGRVALGSAGPDRAAGRDGR